MKILVTGGYGFLGEAVYQRLSSSDNEVIRFRSKEFDLRREEEAERLFQLVEPDIVINLAARLGGIGDNRKYPASYFLDNMKIGMNVFQLSAKYKVQKLTQIGTVCSYPEITPVPFEESHLWNGRPEPTNAAYGVAKRALIELANAMHKQYGLNSSTLLLANLYGPGDDFRDGTSHVIPAIIKKAIEAKRSGRPAIELWGDGSPTRDFLFVEDAAKAIEMVALSESKYIDPMNVGTGKEISIRELVKQILMILSCDFSLEWQTDKPNGQPRRCLNIDTLNSNFGFKSLIDLDEGLRRTIKFYKENKDFLDTQKAKYE